MWQIIHLRTIDLGHFSFAHILGPNAYMVFINDGKIYVRSLLDTLEQITCINSLNNYDSNYIVDDNIIIVLNNKSLM